ncbi:MAG: type IV secretory system conjugative DNA transfer family protein [Roseburia sp.]|nr:type IV secretory system conjugative DNA transfer family protein [Roseburia sp.]
MADIISIVRNNPNSFANANDVCKYLCSYCKNFERKELINMPRKPQAFAMGGMGGVPICFDKEKECVYVDQTDKHSITIGQTGSKKSRLVAMPLVHILGTAQESMIISDPKAEIYHRTCEYLRKEGYEIKVINLREPKNGHAWNPLALPYNFYKEGNIDRAYEFANDIAVNLTIIDKSQKDAFWDNSAGTLFLGLILLLFKFCHEYNEPDEYVSISNILELRTLLFSKGNPQRNPIWEYAKTDRFIESMLIGTVATAEDTRAGILSVFDQKMRAFSVQPALLDMLSRNDSGYDYITEKPSVVYLVLPDEKTGYHNLVSLYIKQSYEYLIYKAQNAIEKNGVLGIRVNYILDEFSSLPAISDFPAMITAARSRNIRFNLFLQSKKQLYLKYNEECHTIMSNCENWIYLSSRELDFLKELSELCGDIHSGNSKPLLSVSDLQKLDKEKGQVLILSGRNKPLITCLPDIDFYDNGRPDLFTRKIQIQKKDSSNDFRKHVGKVLFNTLNKDARIENVIVSKNKKEIDALRVAHEENEVSVANFKEGEVGEKDKSDDEK